MSSTCRYCGSSYDDKALNYWRICPACYAVKQEEARIERKAKFEKKCPSSFHQVDPALIPNPKKYEKVISWQYGPKGMMLYGPSRSGKTRSMWMLMRRLYILESKSNWFFTGQAFSMAVSDAYMGENHTDWFEHVVSRDILMFDDLDKLKFTDRVQSELFSMIDHRMANNLPTIVSTNVSAEVLANMMPMVGEPLVARLAECCELIGFGG